ncbi:MAG: flagellin [Syntrophorhabdus sp. PtaU1.Bin153]|nr:MAG: flagellin [Syntrophorhabdus sp. PtaU1.Bin153]
MSTTRISLTAQMTANLLSLQSTAKLLGTTQERLATGKKVNSAVDDPVAYFDSEAHYQLASDYGTFKNGMSEAVQTIKAATDTIDSVTAILNQMKSIATSAKSSTSSATTGDYRAQFNTLIDQLDNLAGDAIYKGINLLQDDDLAVVFNVDDDTLTVQGFNATHGSLGIATIGASASWFNGSVNADHINSAIAAIDDAIDTLRSKAKVLATNLGIVTTRQDFTSKMIAVLNTGGDNLTLADTNEEGANMLMLQTRQSLGIQSLSIASQSAQAVLSLFQ